MALALQRLGLEGSVLVMLANADEAAVVEHSARNLPDVKTLRASYLNIRDLLGHDVVLMSLDSLQVIQGILGTEEASAPKA
jgi:large subunit ribosomal protein L4